MAAQHTIVLTPELYERVQRLANEQHRSPELVVQDILEEHLLDTGLGEGGWREQLHRDADAALEDYERTGLHVTGEEMDEWFVKTIRGEKVPLPKCHT